MEFFIDGSKIFSEKDFHEVVSKELGLPDWYGKNLDALWDVLTGMVKKPLKIIWLHSEESKKILPRYEQIISLFRDVESQDQELKRDDCFTFEIR